MYAERRSPQSINMLAGLSRQLPTNFETMQHPACSVFQTTKHALKTACLAK